MRFSPNSRCPLISTRKNVSKLSGYFDTFRQHVEIIDISGKHVEAIDMSKKRTYLDTFPEHVQAVDMSPPHVNLSQPAIPEAVTRNFAAFRVPNKSPYKLPDKSTSPATTGEVTGVDTGEVNPPAPNNRTSHRASHVPRWHQVSTKSAPSRHHVTPRHPARVIYSPNRKSKIQNPKS